MLDRKLPRLISAICLGIVSVIAVGVFAVNALEQQIPAHQESFAPSEPVAATCQVDSGKLISYINQERASLGRSPLVVDDALQNSASQKLNAMKTERFYGHNLPDGSDPFGYRHSLGVNAAGAEDIDINAMSPEEDWSAFKNSKSHYESLTNADYTRIGVAAECVDFVIQNGTGPADNSNLVGTTANELTVVNLAAPEPQAPARTTSNGCPVTTCNDGSCSNSTGRGTCSWHGGVAY